MSLVHIFSLHRFGILRNNFGSRNEQQATVESSSELSSLNDWGVGGRDSSATQVQGKQEENTEGAEAAGAH